MLQRLIGVSLGAVVTYLLLVLTNIGSSPEQNYALAVIAGAIVSFLWPWVIGWYLVRRAKDRRDEQISKEVDRQVAEKSNTPR